MVGTGLLSPPLPPLPLLLPPRFPLNRNHRTAPMTTTVRTMPSSRPLLLPLSGLLTMTGPLTKHLVVAVLAGRTATRLGSSNGRGRGLADGPQAGAPSLTVVWRRGGAGRSRRDTARRLRRAIRLARMQKSQPTRGLT